MPIKREDPQAIEKLERKLKDLEQAQERMKSINAYYRKNGTCKGHPEVSDTLADELDEFVAKHSWISAPYSTYALTNNSAEIRRTKMRIQELSKDRDLGFAGWKFEGGKAVANNEICRLQLFFDEKPDAEQRSQLKSYGFKWLPSESA